MKELELSKIPRLNMSESWAGSKYILYAWEIIKLVSPVGNEYIICAGKSVKGVSPHASRSIINTWKCFKMVSPLLPGIDTFSEHKKIFRVMSPSLRQAWSIEKIGVEENAIWDMVYFKVSVRLAQTEWVAIDKNTI